jgi:acyl-homoserine lactone acylase PvdQ
MGGARHRRDRPGAPPRAGDRLGDSDLPSRPGPLGLLRERLGADPDGWHWRRLHTARFPHGVFGGVPVLRRLFNAQTGQGGDASTVNVGAYRRDGSFLMGEGPSYRQIVDLSDLAESLWVHAPGQTGNVFRSGYRSLIPAWRDGRYLSMSPRSVKTLVLEAGE